MSIDRNSISFCSLWIMVSEWSLLFSNLLLLHQHIIKLIFIVSNIKYYLISIMILKNVLIN
ncbi:hypothetical protein BDF19DRAFT_442306 [Syncephalis fuscata]|nr:hypothetical protein BDF19DRAFT_442306 [Syncephalis fuscata]